MSFEEYLLEIVVIAGISLLLHWCMCKAIHSRSPAIAEQPCITAEQESSTGEPAELVISNLQPFQAVERDGEHYNIRMQVPVEETNRGATSKFVLWRVWANY